MLARIVSLGVLAGLLVPLSCLTDEGPDRFTTEGSCFSGDIEGCVCNDVGDHGTRLCKPNGTFGKCRCFGCSILPDCDECGDGCLEKCLCNSPRPERETDCADSCRVDGARREAGTLR